MPPTIDRFSEVIGAYSKSKLKGENNQFVRYLQDKESWRHESRRRLWTWLGYAVVIVPAALAVVNWLQPHIK